MASQNTRFLNHYVIKELIVVPISLALLWIARGPSGLMTRLAHASAPMYPVLRHLP